MDEALRRRAKSSGKSLNETALDALAEGAGVSAKHRKRRDMSDIVGTWEPDKEFLEALADQDRIDEDLWK